MESAGGSTAEALDSTAAAKPADSSNLGSESVSDVHPSSQRRHVLCGDPSLRELVICSPHYVPGTEFKLQPPPPLPSTASPAERLGHMLAIDAFAVLSVHSANEHLLFGRSASALGAVRTAWAEVVAIQDPSLLSAKIVVLLKFGELAQFGDPDAIVEFNSAASTFAAQMADSKSCILGAASVDYALLGLFYFYRGDCDTGKELIEQSIASIDLTDKAAASAAYFAYGAVHLEWMEGAAVAAWCFDQASMYLSNAYYALTVCVYRFVAHLGCRNAAAMADSVACLRQRSTHHATPWSYTAIGTLCLLNFIQTGAPLTEADTACVDRLFGDDAVGVFLVPALRMPFVCAIAFVRWKSKVLASEGAPESSEASPRTPDPGETANLWKEIMPSIWRVDRFVVEQLSGDSGDATDVTGQPASSDCGASKVQRIPWNLVPVVPMLAQLYAALWTVAVCNSVAVPRALLQSNSRVVALLRTAQPDPSNIAVSEALMDLQKCDELLQKALTVTATRESALAAAAVLEEQSRAAPVDNSSATSGELRRSQSLQKVSLVQLCDRLGTQVTVIDWRRRRSARAAVKKTAAAASEVAAREAVFASVTACDIGSATPAPEPSMYTHPHLSSQSASYGQNQLQQGYPADSYPAERPEQVQTQAPIGVPPLMRSHVVSNNDMLTYPPPHDHSNAFGPSLDQIRCLPQFMEDVLDVGDFHSEDTSCLFPAPPGQDFLDASASPVSTRRRREFPAQLVSSNFDSSMPQLEYGAVRTPGACRSGYSPQSPGRAAVSCTSGPGLLDVTITPLEFRPYCPLEESQQQLHSGFTPLAKSAGPVRSTRSTPLVSPTRSEKSKDDDAWRGI